jgi:oligoendopeptidase F
MAHARQQVELRSTDIADQPLPAWDLSDLYAAPESPEVQADLERAAAAATALADEFKGRVGELDGDALAEVIARYEQLEEWLGRAMSYAQLLHAANTEDPEIGRFFQTVQERVNEISTQVLFVTLELNRIEDDALEAKLAASARLAHYRPWIRDVRSFRPHQLDDEIERVLHEKTVTGRRAWTRLFDETMAALRFPYEGRQLTSAEIFDLLQDKDRAKRERAAHAIAEVLGRNTRLFALITNTLAKDKQLEDGWRKFPRPISSRNLANQVEDDVVDALITAVKAAYPRLSHRYYALKARWLGLERLKYWDRNAPLPEDSDKRVPWPEAKVIVLEAYRRFSPTLAEIVDRFFARGWIDAALRPGKDAGAFCHPTVPSVHPYVLMNYQGRPRDVLTRSGTACTRRWRRSRGR